MASTINASSSSGIIQTADTSAILQLQTAGTTALTVDTSANVGIGTTSPSTKLQAVGIIKSGGTGTNGEFNLARTSDGLSVGKISLTESTQILDYNNLLGSGIHTFTVNSVERMRINSSGTVILQGGSTSATGTGITFPATQSASSDANTLDDYEEGTFTPTVTSSTGTITTASATGFYTKIGRCVNITCAVTITTGGTGGGTLKVAGAPFTNANGFQVPNIAKEVDIFGSAGYYCYLLNSGTEIRIEATPSGAPSYTNGVKYCFTLTYITS